MFGLFPPSSSVTFLMFEVAACMILRPVAVPPVKAILSTSMLSASVCPTVGPGPRTSCALPGGKPAFSINANNLIADSGVGLGGLQDAAIARGKAGSEFPCRHQQRIIPRDNLPAHSDRLAHDHRLDGRVRHLVILPERLGDQSRVISETSRRIRRVKARLAQRLAVVERVEFCKLLHLRLDEIGQLEQPRRALGCAHLRPRPFVERLARRLNRQFRVFLRSLGDDADDLVVGGIENLPRRPIRGEFPFPIDKHATGFHELFLLADVQNQ